MLHNTTVLLLYLILGTSCQSERTKSATSSTFSDTLAYQTHTPYDTSVTTIHIMVALCDNKYQGIVPVPKSIGNGQDPKNNLYWGASFGIKTYFKRSQDWTLVQSFGSSEKILERVVFKHIEDEIYIVADAYDGKYIKQTTLDFLNASSGRTKDILRLENKILGISGNANMIAYIGHDGLMDFSISGEFENTDGIQRDIIVLACYSKNYFKPYLKKSYINPLVWTTGLMAPEAYTIHAAISGYLKGETNEKIRIRAAKAYSKYQKCSLSAAKRLLVTGN